MFVFSTTATTLNPSTTLNAARLVTVARLVGLIAKRPATVFAEILVPDADYVSNREADRRVRPLSVKAAVAWLGGALNIEPGQLRAVIAGCGERRIDEYRVGFTQKNKGEVIYGCLWPLYGREDDQTLPEDEAPVPETSDEIAALIKECGVTDIRKLPGILPPEFCEDCGAPFFPNPSGEMVHAELPEDAEMAPAHFH